MALVAAECPHCRRNLMADDTKEAAVCSLCGNPYVVETAIRYRREIWQHAQCPCCGYGGRSGENMVVNIQDREGANICPSCGQPYNVKKAIRAWRAFNRFSPQRDDAGRIMLEQSFQIRERKDKSGNSWLYLMKYTGKDAHVDIPASVQVIQDDAFKGNQTLESVTIPPGTTRIYAGAFQGCIHLKSVVLPEGMDVISNSVFRDCTGLTDVSIPESIREIRERAFQNCTSLLRLTLPPKLKVIENSAFQGCTRLFEIDIPDSVTRLGNSSFQGCAELRRVRIPAGITMVNWGTFSDCRKLEGIDIPPNIRVIDRRAFDDCDSVEELTIPATVKFVHRDAFRKCDILRSVTIGASDSGTSRPPAHDETGEPIPLLRHLWLAAVNWFAEWRESFREDFLHSFQQGEPLPVVEGDAFSECKALKEFNAPLWWKKQHWNCAACLKRYCPPKKRLGCYVATCVYGSYDCPEVWLLRRFRDRVLARRPAGRAFIRLYYGVSPVLVRLFGKARWFRALCRVPLERLTERLRRKGFSDAPYQDPAEQETRQTTF